MSFVVCSSRAWLFALFRSTTLSMFLFGDLVMKSFGDDEVTIRRGLDVDESEARFVISIVLELVSDDRSIWISGCCFCAGCCSLFLASVSLVCTIAASFAFCSNADVLFFVDRMVFLEGESAFLFRSVRSFWEFCWVSCLMVLLDVVVAGCSPCKMVLACPRWVLLRVLRLLSLGRRVYFVP